SIGLNSYSGTIPALWFDEAGTFGNVEEKSKLAVDITSFVLDDNPLELQDEVFVSSGDGFSNSKLSANRVDESEDWVVTGNDHSEFEHLEITLIGSSSFDQQEVLGLF